MKYVLWTILILFWGFLQYWILLFVSSCLVDPNKFYDKHSGYYRWLLVSSTWWLIFVGRVRFHTTGLEKIPRDQRFLLVCNHRSKLDPITTWFLLQDFDLAFISKEANFHVPCWGRLIRRCCFLAIDRDNPRQAMKTIEKAADLIKDDQCSIAVYPEGTRNFKGGLLPFHNGIFKIAQKANQSSSAVSRVQNRCQRTFPSTEPISILMSWTSCLQNRLNPCAATTSANTQEY